MDKFTKTLKTKYKKLLDGGRDKDTLRDHFIWEMMDHDRPTRNELNRKVPKTWDIYNYLMEDERIADNDVIVNRSFFTDKILRVQLSPMYKLKLREQLLSDLEISLNESMSMLRQVRFKDEKDLAEWIVRQKHNLESYLTEWENVVSDVAKKAKTRRLVVQAVKALATEALRPYANVHFEVFEQSRRVKVMVRFLNSNLGLNIYAYYGSYKKTLPPQLDDLKRIIEVLSHNVHKTFFTYSA